MKKWKETAEAHGLDPAMIERKAKAAYMSHFKELPTGRFPPSWESTSEEVRDWVRIQVVDTLVA